MGMVGMPTSSDSAVTSESRSMMDNDQLKDEQVVQPESVKQVDIYLNGEQHQTCCGMTLSECALESASEGTLSQHEVSEDDVKQPAVDVIESAEDVPLEERDVSYFIKPSLIAQQERAWKLQQQIQATAALPSLSSEDSSEEPQPGATTDRKAPKPRPSVAHPPAPARPPATVIAHRPVSTRPPSAGIAPPHTEPSPVLDLGTIRVYADGPTFSEKTTDAPCSLKAESCLRLNELQRFLSTEDDRSTLLDVTVTVQGQVFRSHRLLLVAHSRFFRDLYDGGWLRPQCNVEIGNVSADGFERVLRWINGSRLDLTPSTAKELLGVAQALGIKVLKDECHEYLKLLSQTPNDYVQLYEFSVRHGLASAHEQTGRQAAANFPNVAKSKRYLEYTKDQLCLLLSRDDLNVDSELDVYMVARDWLDHAGAARRDDVGDVFDCVRFKLMTPMELRELLLQLEQSASHNDPDVYLLLQALMYHALRAEGYENQQLGPRPSIRTRLRRKSPEVGRSPPAAKRSAEVDRSPPTAKRSPVKKKGEEEFPIPKGTRLPHLTTQRPRPNRKLNKRSAAVIIQSNYRGYATRQHLAEMDDAAQTIQSNYRGYLIRQQLQDLNEAAAKIQSGFRRYLDHKDYDQLTTAVVPSAEMARV